MGQPALTPARSPGGPSDPPRPPRVLVVDGIAAERALTVMLLKREFGGCEVLEAQDAATFAEHLARGGLELVVTERELGWSSGRSIRDTVRRVFPDCPVVLFSGTPGGGNADDDGYAARLEKSETGYLHLVETVGRLLGIGHGTPGADPALEHLPVGLLLLDTGGRITRSNPRARELLALPEGDLEGRALWELPGLAGSRDRLAPLLRTPAARHPVELHLQGAGTHATALRLRIASGGSVIPFAATLEDVSDYRTECSALERRLKRLQQRGAELERAASAAMEEARALREPTPVAEARTLTPAPAAPDTPTAGGMAPDSSPSAPAAGELPEAVAAAPLSGEESAPAAPSAAEATRFPPGALLAGIAFLGIAVIVAVTVWRHPPPSGHPTTTTGDVHDPSPAPPTPVTAAPQAPAVAGNGAGAGEVDAAGRMITVAPDTAEPGPVAVEAAPPQPTAAGVTEAPAAEQAEPPNALTGEETDAGIAPPPALEAAGVTPAGAVTPQPADGVDIPRRVAELMAEATAHEQARRFTQPPGDNAYASYLRVLQLVPNHPGARAGLAGISERYALWGRNAESRGQWEQAVKYYRLSRAIDPERTGLDAVIRQLESRIRNHAGRR